ncbi:MAG: glycosyltransferase family 9 protein [Bacteroidota bacterium]
MGKNKLLIFKSGLLGDTLVSLPALNLIRNNYPNSEIIYLWMKLPNSDYVTPPEILAQSGLVDRFLYITNYDSIIKRYSSYLKVWFILYFQKIEIGIVLEPPYWSAFRKTFLLFCGIKKVIGPNSEINIIERDIDGDICKSENVADMLMAQLSDLDIDIPEKGCGEFKLHLNNSEKNKSKNFLINNQLSSKILIGVAPVSNMPSKCWPIENYYSVLKELIKEFNIEPIMFGSKKDFINNQKLVSRLEKGFNVSGEVNVREGIALLSHCKLYLGNDTGTMHMAAAAGIKCVAIFSSIDMPGKWYPYGTGHKVFRTKIECEGCLLKECIENKSKCITSINYKDVYNACKMILNESL